MKKTSKKEVKEVKKIEMLEPAYSLRNRMAALFGQDQDVTVLYDEKAKSYNIIIGGCEHKAEAMRLLLKGTFTIANKKYSLLVNGHKKTYKTKVNASVIKAAFAGNKVVRDLYIKYNEGVIDKWALLMKNTTIQFPNDNAGSPYGFETYSAEELAKIVFADKVECVLPVATESSVGENGYWDYIFGETEEDLEDEEE